MVLFHTAEFLRGHQQCSCELVGEELVEVVAAGLAVVNERIIVVPGDLHAFYEMPEFVCQGETLANATRVFIDIDAWVRVGGL